LGVTGWFLVKAATAESRRPWLPETETEIDETP
jgi:hypothetical protein